MAKIFSDEDVMGAPAAAKKVKVLSDADVLGQGDELDQRIRAESTPARRALRGVGDVASNIGKSALAAGDMILGAPASLTGNILNWGRRANAAVRGESAAFGAEQGAAAENLGILEGLKTPFQTLGRYAGIEPIDQSIVEEGFKKGAEGVSKVTGGAVSPDTAMLTASTLMNALGTASIRPTVRALTTAKKPGTGAENRGSYDNYQEVITDPPAPGSAGIPDPVIIEKPAQVKKIFDDAKAAGKNAAVTNLFERVKREGLSRAEAAAAAVEESQARIATQKQRSSEGVLLEEPAAPPAFESLLDAEGNPINATLASATAKVVRGETAMLTPEERIQLRGQRQELEARMGGPDKIQKGAIDPELLKLMGIGAGSALATSAAIGLWNWFKDDGGADQKRWREDQRDQKQQEDMQNPAQPPLPGEPKDLQDRRKRWIADAGVGAGLLAAAAGVMKVKGEPASWHPKVLEDLSRPLLDKLASTDMLVEHGVYKGPEEGSVNPYAAWPERAVKNYLNKHAATPTDPIADVQIPHGQETARWGDLIDAATEANSASTWKESVKRGRTGWEGLDKTPAHEKIISLNAEGYVNDIEALSSVRGYLSHVGDYLRERVPADKLPNYDLTRAVKETAKWDAELAKKMNDARLNDIKDATIYKEYPKEGMAWVELNKPGQFARESDAMGHSVRGYEPEIRRRNGQQADLGTPHPDWVEASGDSGHSSYGHGGWEAIKRGDAKILSLRDLKTGESHATVEIAKDADVRIPTNSPEHYARVVGGDWLKKWNAAKATGDVMQEVAVNREIIADPAYQAWIKEKPASITQIKGKQNRAPSEKYLPFIQDLVKSGKWGDVGDLGNTGLTKGSDIFKYDDVRAAAKAAGVEFEPNKYYTQAEIDAAIKGNNEADAVYAGRNLKDFKTVGAVAGTAALASQLDSEDQQALAAGGLLAATGKGARQIGRGLDYALGATSTRLGNISPALKLRARDFEAGILREKEAALNRVAPFLQAIKKVPEGSELDLALLRNEGVEAKLPPEARPAYAAVRKLLDEFETAHKALGRFKEGVTEYFPRIVTDLDGLKKALGQTQRTHLEEVLAKAEAKMIKEQQRGLTDVETSIIVNRSLQADGTMKNNPGYIHGRGVQDLTPELRPFYASPTDSLLRYISGAVTDLEMAKFFGKDLKTSKVNGKTVTNIDDSIGSIVAEELKAGRLTHDAANELRGILKSRFEGGEQSMAAPLQDARNLTNVALLGQFGSAATQIGDSVMTVYHHGLMPTLTALKQKLTGDSQVSSREFGLVNHIAEELGSNRYTGKALQAVFKANGFALIDQFAKGLNLNAGLVKNQKLASTAKGRAELATKYAEAFGDEFPQLLQDLQTKNVTPNVRSLLFSELSDAQPITKMEMPQAYLDNPNGRLLYQMKTYMLKQMDVIRRDAFQEIAKGNYVKGAKNLVAVASAMALSNVPGDVIKNWLSGRDAELDKIDLTESLLKNFGVSRYSLDQAGSGKPLEVVRDMGLPPYKHFQELLNAATTGKEKDQAKAAKYVPLIGRHYYDRELGGNEARLKVEKKRQRLETRDELEAAYPNLKAQRLARQAKRNAR